MHIFIALTELRCVSDLTLIKRLESLQERLTVCRTGSKFTCWEEDAKLKPLFPSIAPKSPSLQLHTWSSQESARSLSGYSQLPFCFSSTTYVSKGQTDRDGTPAGTAARARARWHADS